MSSNLTRELPETPACFSEDDWARWWSLNRQCSRLAAPNYCYDCTLPRQQEMIALDRCPHPETVFLPLNKMFGTGERDREIVGYRVRPRRGRHAKAA